jgi:hypothetical protein
MPKIWPHATIRELFALANAKGESRAMLGSKREAELFRFAIYSFRRQNDLGWNLSVTLDDNVVVVTRRLVPNVTIIQDDDEDPNDAASLLL